VKAPCLALALVAATAAVSAQPAARRATNLAALLAHPGFFHLRPIVIVGRTTLHDNGELRLADESGSIRVVFKGRAPDGMSELRGEFWDLGRMSVDDTRLAAYDLKETFGIDPESAWPRPGQNLAIVATAVAAAQNPAAPSVRNIVLHPSRYADQRISVTGQFGGRNLLGDLPDAPAQSRWDFVLRSADAAIWVTNIRPRGRDFELALDARIDTGRWLELSGRLQQGRGLQWLDAEPGSLKLVPPPKETPPDEPQIRVPAAPPPEVVFSAPTQDETEVLPTTSVRIQFSRDINPATFRGRIRVTYPSAETRDPGEPGTPAAEFTTQYLPGTRVLEIKFMAPLERLRTVTVELLDGIMGSDKQALAPWTLTFQTGG